MNYFIEGIQGSGKTTMAEKMSKRHPGCHVYKEGFYSPVELAWCAYVDEDTYQELAQKYPYQMIKENTYLEDDKRIICYTKIQSDDRSFYQDLEQYEIYNDRKSLDEFRSIILNRYRKWQGSNSIFECSLFQNIIEELILYKQMPDEEILSFYRQIREILKDQEYLIIYLKTDDISDNLNHVRKERTDDQGKEIWFELLCDYFNASPYARDNDLRDEEGIISHLKHRQELELKICDEIFPDHSIILDSQKYDEQEIDRL